MAAVNLAMVTERGGHRVVVSFDGTRLESPPVEHMAFFVGMGVLAATEVIEWPLAVLLMTGHLLLDATNRPALHQLGEAFAEA
jgi:hypothetical protein